MWWQNRFLQISENVIYKIYCNYKCDYTTGKKIQYVLKFCDIETNTTYEYKQLKVN